MIEDTLCALLQNPTPFVRLRGAAPCVALGDTSHFSRARRRLTVHVFRCSAAVMSTALPCLCLLGSTDGGVTAFLGAAFGGPVGQPPRVKVRWGVKRSLARHE